MTIRALLAEDEPTLANIIKERLAERQIDLHVAGDGEAALQIYKEKHIDILITDVRMPRLDGLSLIKRIRTEDKDLPIIIITVNGETEDVEQGFEVGADDYLRKPFSIRELVARIHALTRRSQRQTQTDVIVKGATKQMLSFGHFVLDVPGQRLIYAPSCKEELQRSLSFRETSILYKLIAAKGDVVDNKSLLNDLWGSDDVYNLNSLYVFITRLKNYLATDTRVAIINARGIGYRLVCQ